MQAGRWAFVVGTNDATAEAAFWWHSPDAEVEFETGGTADPVFHEQSLPYFLEPSGAT